MIQSQVERPAVSHLSSLLFSLLRSGRWSVLRRTRLFDFEMVVLDAAIQQILQMELIVSCD
jgi:hypothetical protein